MRCNVALLAYRVGETKRNEAKLLFQRSFREINKNREGEEKSNRVAYRFNCFVEDVKYPRVECRFLGLYNHGDCSLDKIRMKLLCKI